MSLLKRSDELEGKTDAPAYFCSGDSTVKVRRGLGYTYFNSE